MGRNAVLNPEYRRGERGSHGDTLEIRREIMGNFGRRDTTQQGPRWKVLWRSNGDR